MSTSNERRALSFALLAVLTIAYLGGAAFIAMRRPLWNDELYTLLIADSPTMADVWAALATGADQVPPPFHVVTRASLAILGVTRLGLRAPEVLGFFLMGACLYGFAARRMGVLYATITMAFPLVTTAFDYAHEGRSYALVLGFGALALLCWQSAREDVRRGRALVGLAAGVAAAVCSHYYAVLIVVPLAIAELVRWAVERRVRLGVPIALVIGLAPLVFFLPLIAAARSYSVNFWAQPSLSMIAAYYFWMLAPAATALGGIFTLAAAYSLPAVAAWDPPPPDARTGLRSEELAAAAAFAALPAIAVLIGFTVTGVFTLRYALAGILGLALLFGAGVHRAFDGRPGAAVGTLAILLACFVVVEGRALNSAKATVQRQVECERLLEEGPPSLPIAVADPLTFLKLSHKLPPALRSRTVYLADPDVALRRLGFNTVDRGLVDLEPWFGARVEPFVGFAQTNPRFLVLARTTDAHGEIWRMGWLLAELAAKGARIELVGRNADDLLFVVEPDGADRSILR